MASQNQDKVLVDCPHCGFKCTVAVPTDSDASTIGMVVLGGDFLGNILRRVGRIFKDQDKEELEANKGWKVKKCPNCGRNFE
ncbi:MAG: hypothetical protein WCD37_01495, partial [Chloroflexia bacterium]